MRLTLVPGLVGGLCLGACSGSIGGLDHEPSSEEPGRVPRGDQGGVTGPGPGAGAVDLPDAPPAGPCPVQMPLRRLTPAQYESVVREAFGGRVRPSARFPALELGSARTGFSTEPAANVVTRLGAEYVMDAAAEVATAVMTEVGGLVPCAQGALAVGATPAQRESCARTFVRERGMRLYRRPLANDEEEKLIGLFRSAAGGAEPFRVGVGLVTWAMLQAPQFLYLIETGEPAAPGERTRLTSWELASRLSFLLWDGPPDAELLAAARDGGLRDEAALRAQAERMLDDPRAAATLARFAAEWAHVGHVEGKDRPTPGFDDALAEAQRGELSAFVAGALRGGKSVAELFTTRTTMADRRIAAYYGADTAGRRDGAFEPLELPAERGHSGILTMPAVLTARAHSDEPAYVFRGTFVLEKLMCVDLPIPPPDAALMLPDFPPGASQREKSALIRGVRNCNGCHAMIDPIGHSFEGFDEIGRARAAWPDGRPVDTSGEVVDVDATVNGPFASPAELGQRLGESAVAARCVAKQLFRFAYARFDGDADRCAVDGMLWRYRQQGQSLREMLLALVESEGFSFTQARAE